jgi:hypothetical protein
MFFPSINLSNLCMIHLSVIIVVLLTLLTLKNYLSWLLDQKVRSWTHFMQQCYLLKVVMIVVKLFG